MEHSDLVLGPCHPARDFFSSPFTFPSRHATTEITQVDPFEEDWVTPPKNRPRWKGFGHMDASVGHNPLHVTRATLTRKEDAVIPYGQYDKVHVRNLIHTLRGYPLWNPTPDPRWPLDRRRKGFQLGDVGTFREEGMFQADFNIFLPVDHSFHKGRTPPNFTPFRVGPRTVRKRTFGGNIALTGPTVLVSRIEETNEGNHIEIDFEAAGSEGAILILPCGAASEDLGDVPGLRQYIADNIFSWYVDLRKQGRLLSNGDIRVVIGTDKSHAWSYSTFASPDGISKDNFRATFSTFNTPEGVRHTYTCSGTCYHVTGGPDAQDMQAIREPGDATTGYCSETLFLRTLNPMLSVKYWEACQTNDEPPQGEPPKSKGLGAISNLFRLPSGIFNWLHGVRKSTRKQSSRLNDVAVVSIRPHCAQHPSNALNAELLKHSVDASVVITQDYEWMNAVKSEDHMTPDLSPVIVSRILTRHSISVEQGVLFLKDIQNA